MSGLWLVVDSSIIAQQRALLMYFLVELTSKFKTMSILFAGEGNEESVGPL